LATQQHTYPAQIFRANDIRGLAEQELTDDFTCALGHAFAKRVIQNGESQVMICRDARLSSPRLHRSLLIGLHSRNIKVVDIGIGPTPLLGFGLAQSDNIHSGIMITASHNPSNQNGFKMVLSNSIFFGDELKSLYEELEHSNFVEGADNSQPLNLENDYISAIKNDIPDLSGLSVVVDSANGAAGLLAIATLKALGAHVIAQFCEPDGRFPNRSPDTSNPENLQLLQKRVLAEKADVGIGFDGDGDRMVAVTQKGRLLNADEVICIFAQSALKNSPGSNIVYDIKCSTDVGQSIQEMGGTPVMHRSGRSFIQAKMLEKKAAFAGEYSAHYFFQDRWCGTDDGIYAACRLLQLCNESGKSLEEICDSFSGFGQGSGKVASGEIYLGAPEDSKFAIIEQLLQKDDVGIDGEKPNIIRIDGLRLEYAQGWALVRASNTSAALTLRFEAKNNVFMASLTKKVAEMLKSVSTEIDTDGIHHVT